MFLFRRQRNILSDATGSDDVLVVAAAATDLPNDVAARSQVLVPKGVSKGCDVVSVEREKRTLITRMFGQSMGVSKNDDPLFAVSEKSIFSPHFDWVGCRCGQGCRSGLGSCPYQIEGLASTTVDCQESLLPDLIRPLREGLCQIT